MSTSEPQSDMSATEELVAYLDGELPAEACRRVEKRLAVDAEYRRQLSELDQAWSALEVLPAATVDQNFTRTTIDMVAVAAERDLAAHTAALAVRRSGWRWAAIAGGAALLLAGLVVARGFSTRWDRLLVADLPVVAQLDELSQVRDIEFLRGLSKLGVDRFKSLTDVVTPTAAKESLARTDSMTPAERRDWIENRTESERGDLAARFKRFEDLAPAQQEQLRGLSRQIEQAVDREELEAALAAYAAWTIRRTPGERLELRELNSDERLARVEQLLKEERRTVVRELSPADEEALQDAILEFVEERRRQLDQDPNTQHRWANRPTAMVALGIIFQDMRDERRRDELQQLLTAELSEPAREHFRSLRPRERGRQLWIWMREAMQPKFGPKELQAYFASEKLTNDQREELLSLPRSEMEERLERMYVTAELGLPGGDWDDWGRGRGFGRDGRGDGRGPRDRGRGWRGPDGRNGPPRDFDPRRFDDRRFGGDPGRPNDRPPFVPPRPHGPPPQGGPRDWRDGPPPGPPREGGERSGDGPPREGPPPPRNDSPPHEEPF